jgi:4-hydroxy-tetrahydrodipicolinate synthase
MVAIVTPFKNGELDEQTFRDLIEFQIANGTQGIIPCGTTGESATLSFKEHERVVEITVEQVDRRIPVIAGTGSNNTEEAIRLTRHAKTAGADGALMISPYYNKPTQEGLYQHFRKVAQSVDIPIVLYNIPGRTAVNMEPVHHRAPFPYRQHRRGQRGIRQHETDHGHHSRMRHDFDVLSGEDYLTFPLLCVGGKGVISVVSNVAPRDMADLCTLYLDGNIDESRKLYYRLLPLCHALFIETNPAPVKAALAMMNKIGSEEVRLPLAPLSESSREKLRKNLEAYGLLGKSPALN